MGNVQISSQALHMLLEAGIDIGYFSYSGRYIGHSYAGNSNNIFLRIAQYELYENMERRLTNARAIVANKISNQIALIENYNWAKIDFNYSKEIALLQSQIEILPQKITTNQLMGVEGNCSSIYFSVFAHMFKCSIQFERRTRRPPKDPINVILSLAYTFLTKEIICLLESESFETYLGFLHGIRRGRQSLALDIIEEFRQPIVDRLVLFIFNKQIVGELDFEYRDGRCVLMETGFKKFCLNYEKWMEAPIGGGDVRSFRKVMKTQISELKRAIKSGEDYTPYSWGKNICI